MNMSWIKVFRYMNMQDSRLWTFSLEYKSERDRERAKEKKQKRREQERRDFFLLIILLAYQTTHKGELLSLSGCFYQVQVHDIRLWFKAKNDLRLSFILIHRCLCSSISRHHALSLSACEGANERERKNIEELYKGYDGVYSIFLIIVQFV